MEQPTWIGRALNGRYKIDALLGSGGMSAVYKAFDPNLKRIVAIKLIHPHLSTEEDFIYRFKQEAAAVAAFRHPNIVQVYDFNIDGDVYYMVLEFVPGETLQDHLKHLKKSNTQIALDRAVNIIINVCDALAYAHKRGTIHRDIKPANIMLDLQGQAILMDFGIVKILGDTSHTATGAVVGTARYMSPEVIRSEAPDERSDIYSLGVAFFELLSGQAPFNADSAMSLLMRHLNDPIPDLNSIRSDTPSELKRIINKSLEKDRNNRYRTVDEMAGDLRRFLSTLETVPIPTSGSTPKSDPAPAIPEPTSRFDQTGSATEPWMEPKPASLVDPALSAAPRIKQEFVPVNTDAAMDITEPDVAVARPPAPAITKKQNAQNMAVPAAKTSASSFIKFGVIGIVLLFLVIAGIYLLNRPSTAGSENTETFATQTVDTGATQNALLVAQQTVDAGLTQASVLPTETPTETPVPLTPTPTTPYVLITGIRIEGDKYVVDYEVHNFPEASSLHVHMFFDTVAPEQAGSPGSGPWKLTYGAYGDPPFTQYGPANRPANATQMCALVANPNHTVVLASGNCFFLP